MPSTPNDSRAPKAALHGCDSTRRKSAPGWRAKSASAKRPTTVVTALPSSASQRAPLRTGSSTHRSASSSGPNTVADSAPVTAAPPRSSQDPPQQADRAEHGGDREVGAEPAAVHQRAAAAEPQAGAADAVDEPVERRRVLEARGLARFEAGEAPGGAEVEARGDRGEAAAEPAREHEVPQPVDEPQLAAERVHRCQRLRERGREVPALPRREPEHQQRERTAGGEQRQRQQ